MQPMGHVQLLRNLLDFKMDPQAALDAPRWYIVGPGRTQSADDVRLSEILIEQGYGDEFDGAVVRDTENGPVVEKRDVADGLRMRGHKVGAVVSGSKRSLYGRGQIILRNPDTGVLWGGSDPRADGCALPVP